MRLVHAPDGAVDRFERALWLTMPFDMALAADPAIIGMTGEAIAKPYFSGEDFSTPSFSGESLAYSRMANESMEAGT